MTLPKNALWSFIRALTTATSLAIGLTVMAADISPTQFQHYGIVASANATSPEVVAGRLKFSIESSTKIYGRDGKELSLKTLRSGMNVRFNLDSSRTSTVKEMMVLPSH